MGNIRWDKEELAVQDTVKSAEGTIVLKVTPETVRPPIGTIVNQEIDWDRRYKHMRLHSALHLLTVILPFPVTGGQISTDKGRLDFNMPAPEESKQEMEKRLNELIEQNLKIYAQWIDTAELNANPSLVKTMSVQPPSDQDRVRIVYIGEKNLPIDRQPCGGTHVATTSEIGKIAFGKVENKGKNNRRVTIKLT